jgi:rubrerythrin
MRSFGDLDEREILALAVSSEEEDGRIYRDFAESLRQDYPDTAKLFDDMAAEENEHRRALIDAYVARFGNHIPYITRRDVRGAPSPPSASQVSRRGIEAVRARAEQMEADSRRLPPSGRPLH